MSQMKKIEISLNNETIKLKRKVALSIRNTKGLNFHPIIVDVLSAVEANKDGIRVVAKMTQDNGKLCRCCNKTLKQDLSMLVGVGPTCSKHLGLKFLNSVEEVESFRESVNKRVEEVGTFDFWLPYNQVREYIKGNRLKNLTKFIQKTW